MEPGACDAGGETDPVVSPNEPTAPATPSEAESEAVSPNEPDPDASPGETEASADPDAPAQCVEPRTRKGRKVRAEEEPIGTILLRLMAEEAQQGS